MSNSTLTLNDVQEKHAGVYTLSLGNQVKGMYKNLSYTLIVNGKLSP